MIGFPSVGKSTLLTKLTGTPQSTQEPSRKSQHISSPHSPVYQECWITKELKYNCWICRESSKEPKTEKEEEDRSLQWPEPATSSSSSSTPLGPCNTKKSSNTNSKDSESDSTNNLLKSISKRKIKEESPSQEWSIPTESAIRPSKPSSKNIESTTQTYSSSAMPPKTISSMSSKATENTSPVYMPWTKSMPSLSINSTFSIK